MEAVARFSDPLAAAKHVVQDAFRTWLRYEVRTDDITIVVLFIEDFKEGQEQPVRAPLDQGREACDHRTARSEAVLPLRRCGG